MCLFLAIKHSAFYEEIVRGRGGGKIRGLGMDWGEKGGKVHVKNYIPHPSE